MSGMTYPEFCLPGSLLSWIFNSIKNPDVPFSLHHKRITYAFKGANHHQGAGPFIRKLYGAAHFRVDSIPYGCPSLIDRQHMACFDVVPETLIQCHSLVLLIPR